MKSEQWKTYRTRFLVKAKQLSSSLSFVDHLGRQHCGRKGDYLVESSDGVLSIAPRRIFEDIYVPMPCWPNQTRPANQEPAAVPEPMSESMTEPMTRRAKARPSRVCATPDSGSATHQGTSRTTIRTGALGPHRRCRPRSQRQTAAALSRSSRVSLPHGFDLRLRRQPQPLLSDTVPKREFMPTTTNPDRPRFPQCGKPGPNPASSPSLLGIQPVVFPS